MQKGLGENVGDSIWSNIRHNIGVNTRDSIIATIRVNIGENIRDSIGHNIRGGIEVNIRENISPQSTISPQTQTNVKHQIETQCKKA